MNIIEVKGISKQYVLSDDSRNYTTVREHIVGLFKRREAQKPAAPHTLLALHDVSFAAQRGDVVGIIGRNGAGKSTLLKIISKITYPTEGEIILRGTVGSLLEAGTGFHPELTGRENIYINGRLIGMSKQQIDSKYKSIVDFSGIEKFIDVPVKKYSSGMAVRLAFSIGVFLQSDILLIDEVLAVGDAEFQRKCLDAIADIARRKDRAVIFVSHNTQALRMLCNRVIVMENGHVACDTTTENALEYYQTLLSTGRPLRRSFKYGTLSHAHLENGEGHKGFCRSGDAITFRIGYNLSQRPEELAFMLVIADEANNRIARMARNLEKAEIAERRNELSCAIQNFNLAPGRYRVHIHITGDGISEVIADALSFVVSSTTGNEVYNNHFYAPKVVYEGIWNIHHGT